MAPRKVLKNFSIDWTIDSKLRKVPYRQSWLVNSLLRLFFETCEEEGIDWKTELYEDPDGLLKRVCGRETPPALRRTKQTKQAKTTKQTKLSKATEETKATELRKGAVDPDSFW